MRTRRTRLGQGLLVLAGLINVVPGAGAVAPESMPAAYGVEIEGVDLEVLLRHRAVLLALVGVLAIVSAFRPALRPAAITGNAVSMGTFLLLVLTTPAVNQQVVRVAQVDAAALVVLAAGAVLTWNRPGRREGAENPRRPGRSSGATSG
ncbi:hypothetical protein ACFWN2_30905 [Lentzea sp. NPDC058436]|uniref:hypothetical protein n=1 Tax=Lentzea sp. NPDC058436 TaxID=3346499 RepID=UPI00365EF1B2